MKDRFGCIGVAIALTMVLICIDTAMAGSLESIAVTLRPPVVHSIFSAGAHERLLPDGDSSLGEAPTGCSILLACGSDTVVTPGTAWGFTSPIVLEDCGSPTWIATVSNTVTLGPCTGDTCYTRCWIAADEDGNQSALCCQSVIVRVGIPCMINGPQEVAEGSVSSYCGPLGLSSYQWLVDGNATLISSSDQRCAEVQAGTGCGSGFTLSLRVMCGGTPVWCGMTVEVLGASETEGDTWGQIKAQFKD